MPARVHLQTESGEGRKGHDEDHHVQPRVHGHRGAGDLRHDLQAERAAVRAVELVDAVADAGVLLPVRHQPVREQRHPAQPADRRLVEARVEQAQAAREEDELQILQAVGQPREHGPRRRSIFGCRGRGPVVHRPDNAYRQDEQKDAQRDVAQGRLYSRTELGGDVGLQAASLLGIGADQVDGGVEGRKRVESPRVVGHREVQIRDIPRRRVFLTRCADVDAVGARPAQQVDVDSQARYLSRLPSALAIFNLTPDFEGEPVLRGADVRQLGGQRLRVETARARRVVVAGLPLHVGR